MSQVTENATWKVFQSPSYNYVFDRITGYFARWGTDREDDPTWSPFGPEILDLEISTGACKGRCRFCYKANGTPINHTKHMTLDTFKRILEKMPNTLTQIAFGITDVYGNPDFFDMMRYAREQGVVPNYTTHGLDLDQNAINLTTELCGAVAVSVVNKQKTFEAVQALSKRMKQVNIHFMISEERLEDAYQLICDMKDDPRLYKMNAVVFLQYKPKGRFTDQFTPITFPHFRELVEYCEAAGVRFGFDSCTAPMYEKIIEGRPEADRLREFVEPCESAIFSSYVNADGDFFPCSFCEGQPGWEEGISVVNCKTFDDVWSHKRVREWRINLWQNCRACPMYDLGDEQSRPLYQLEK